ncbi:MAG: subunit beta of phenylalanyl-tRNA synthetase [Thermoleophilia bacterium]|nr:subunit beta of phenylalanyl-tRNA synthetase [Thermoleophilia bacterium]
MRVPYSWLRQYVPGAPADPAGAARLLTISGTAVEGIEHVGVAQPEGEGGQWFRIGKVLEFDKHPDADKLRLVQVDAGEGAPRQIVCGASNFQQGDTVAIVLPGGRMPDGMEIREAKLRGVDSRGMMVSERELGLSTDHAGIMVLPSQWQAGDLVHDHVALGDDVLEFEITGNRPDCLGVYGIARELATAAGVELLDAWSGDAEATAPGDVRDHVTVDLQAHDLCQRYMARAFVDVTVGPSPLWLKARLARAGMRAINNVVDVTNYVMLLTGQPLHAFDAERIAGATIVVRRAHEGEQVTTLDDVQRTLDPDMLAIADAQDPVVIAGIMGAARVEVTPDTTSLVLEAACFDGLAVQRASRELGLRSESSSRFDKGLDPHLPEVALRLASKLLVELCDARLVPGTIDEGRDEYAAAPPVVALPAELAPRVLGIDVPAEGVEDTLTRLGYRHSRTTDGWNVVVPHWRMHDTTRPIDLVEEIGRFRLEQVPSRLPAVASGGAMLTRAQRMRRLLEDTAAGLGLHEVVTYGLVEPGTAVALGVPEAEVVALANPMTTDHAELRTSLLSGHLEVARRNASVGQPDVAIFEVGRTFFTAAAGTVGDDGLPRFANERDVLALLITGSLGADRWDLPGVPADLHAAAGLVASLAAAAGVELTSHAVPNPPSWLHPGQSAELRSADGVGIGWVAAVHPRFAAAHGVEADTFAAHLDLTGLEAAGSGTARFRAFSEFPPIVEDIALVLDDAVPGGAVVRAAREAGGALLESVSVFDRYVGAPIADGAHSLALRLVFRAPDRTLTDDETAAVRATVVERLRADFDAELRG